MSEQTVKILIRLLLRSSLIRIYTVCHSFYIFWRHYFIVKLNCFILRTTTVAGLGVPIFRVFTVYIFTCFISFLCCGDLGINQILNLREDILCDFGESCIFAVIPCRIHHYFYPSANNIISQLTWIYAVCKINLFLTLKAPKKKIAADDILIFHFYLLKKIRLDFSCESSA